jgi:hypothetical protein
MVVVAEVMKVELDNLGLLVAVAVEKQLEPAELFREMLEVVDLTLPVTVEVAEVEQVQLEQAVEPMVVTAVTDHSLRYLEQRFTMLVVEVEIVI